MEVTDLLSNETNIYQWPVTQHIDAEGHVTTVSHRSLTLKPGSYDFVLLLTSQDLAKHQYLSKALGVVIVDGENPVLDFVLSPNLGETINSFEEIKYVSTLKFSWPNEDLAGFNAPQLGLTINQGEETVYTINKQTGLAQVTMNVEPGEYSLVLHLYDGDLMVGKNANQDKPINLMEGEDTHINMISLQADIIISLDPLSSKGIFTFIVPPEVVNEVGAAHDLMLLVRLGGEGELQEQALTVIDENGVYKASGLFKTDGEKSILAYLAFHRVIDASNQYNEAPFAHCNTKVYIEQNQKLACKIELKRESIITQRLLGTLMLSVLDEQGLPSIGTEVFLNGKSIGLTGEHYSVGSIKTHQISGNYKLKAQNSTYSASAEVTLRPLEIVNKTLTLKPFLGNEIPDFNFVSITPSNFSDPKAMLRFLWDGQTQGNTYTVCAKDASQENACYPLASITGQAQLDVPLKATYLLAGKEFFILAQRGDARQNTLSLKIPPFALNSLVQKIKVGNANNDEFFSSALALSADGNTLAVGASKEDLSAVGIDGHPLRFIRKMHPSLHGSL